MIVNFTKLIFASALMLLVSAPTLGQQSMPNYALASQLATKARANVRQRDQTDIPITQNNRLQRHRNSAIDSSISNSREAGCGGVAIGNVRPLLGDHRQHNVTVVVTGDIYNTGNDC